MAQQTQEQDINHLLKVRREKLAELQQNGRDPFQITKFDQTHHSLEVKGLYEAHETELLKDRQEPNVEGMDEEQAKEALKKDYEERRNIMDASPIHVAIAGRMMFKRVMGKASFCNIQDLQGNIQVYVARDAIGTESYADFKKSDIGDIFGVEGFAFRTRTGEISIHAEKVTLLSKSLQILPEKFHGLTDVDTRYRQRYVDLIMNTESKDTFIKRSKILSAIRKYLSGEGFMEVETPMLVQNAGGAAARPFETHFNALNEDLKLRISLELYLKRLIVGGLEKVYEIGRVFRNEGLDTRHNPEFTLMELYQAFTDYHGMMDLTENLYRFVAQEVLGTTQIVYKGIPMDLGKPFERPTLITLLALALQVHLPLCGHDGLDIVGLAQGFHPHIIVHAEQGVFEVGTGKAVLRDFADVAILHVAAEQPGQHHADLRLTLAAAALDDHHALALVAGNQAVADELLHCGDVLRVEQVGQKPQPVDGLGGFRVILDREPVADDLRLALLKGTVQIQGAVCQCDTVGDRRKVLHLCRQLQHIHHIGDLLGEVRPNVFTHHLENFTAQVHGVCDPAVRGEKCAIHIEELVGAEKIVTKQGFVEEAFLDPCRGKVVSHRHTSFLRCCGLSMWSIWPHGFSLLQQVDKRPLGYGKSMWTICLH